MYLFSKESKLSTKTKQSRSNLINKDISNIDVKHRGRENKLILISLSVDPSGTVNLVTSSKSKVYSETPSHNLLSYFEVTAEIKFNWLLNAKDFNSQIENIEQVTVTSSRIEITSDGRDKAYLDWNSKVYVWYNLYLTTE